MFKAAMAQIRVESGRPEANMDRAVARIQEAARQGCRLVVLPECMDLGWTHDGTRTAAQPIPGPRSDRLATVARETGMFVAAGLVEKKGETIYNAAVLIDPLGKILLHHRKINLLDIEQYLYATGDRLGVVETELGILGLNICADNFESSLAIGHVLARMGAQVIVSPSAWAVGREEDPDKTQYEKCWLGNYSHLCRLYEITIIGVSNVGFLTEGPWKGSAVIGRSLAVGPNGEILALGPYGRDAEALVIVDVEPKPRDCRGTDIAGVLEIRGYRGP